MLTGDFVTEQPFDLPEAKTSASYKSRNVLFVGTNTGEGSLTDSGYPRQVREWVRGTDIQEAPIVFEGEATDVSVGAYIDDNRHYGGPIYEIRYRAYDASTRVQCRQRRQMSGGHSQLLRERSRQVPSQHWRLRKGYGRMQGGLESLCQARCQNGRRISTGSERPATLFCVTSGYRLLSVTTILSSSLTVDKSLAHVVKSRNLVFVHNPLC